jgi:thioesterase domain-containing protein
LPASSGPLVVLRAATAGRPLFLVHAGEGDVSVYGQMVRRLPERPVYGFQSVGLDGEQPPLMNISRMASLYLQHVVLRDPIGPYLLGGARMGASVAFEMARQLAEQGRAVGLVALFDFAPPATRWLARPTQVLTNSRDRLRILGWNLIRALRRKQKHRWLADYRAFIAKINCHSRHDYQPGFYNGTITVFLTGDRKGKRHEQLPRYAREVRLLSVPGGRNEMFVQPAVNELARQLERCLNSADQEERP